MNFITLHANSYWKEILNGRIAKNLSNSSIFPHQNFVPYSIQPVYVHIDVSNCLIKMSMHIIIVASYFTIYLYTQIISDA